jgi:hypothetical protein
MIKRPDGNLMGYNVDYLGAIAAIEEGLRGFEHITSYEIFYSTSVGGSGFNNSTFYMQQMVQTAHLVLPWLGNCLSSWVLVVLEKHLLLVEKKREQES